MFVKKILAGTCLVGALTSVNAYAAVTATGESNAHVIPSNSSTESGNVQLASCCSSADWSIFDPKSCDSGCSNLTSCDASCDGCDGCGLLKRRSGGVLGLGILPSGLDLIKKSEHCYSDFISPMTNPVYFEDPRQNTEARAIFINHKIPVVAGNPSGRVQLYAVQARVRLTENLSLIAVKDGYVVSQSPLLDDGWADLSAGLKYSLYRDAQAGRLLSVGGRFEMPTGMGRTLQGNGDGVLDIFASGGTRIGDTGHLLSAAGFILPMDSQAENQMFYWSNHLDKRVSGTNIYGFTELNWYNYMKSGSAFPLPLQGGDLFNLGAAGVAGNNLVTNAYGLKYKPSRNIESGVAFEFPLTERRGLLDNRLTVDLIVRF